VHYPDQYVDYAPDALGRATRIGNYATNISYFPDGAVQGYTLGNGIAALVERNARQLPSNLSYAKGGTLLLSEDYGYDKDGNLTAINDLVDGGNSQTLGYDALNRLTSASAPHAWGTESYAYDPLNNLRQRVIGGYPFNLNVDGANRLASVTIGSTPFTSYQSNAAGDRIGMTYNGSTTSYRFDAKHQLLQIPGVASYAYDAAGRRVKKGPDGSGPSQGSFYSQSGELMVGYDEATGQYTDYLYLGGRLIARRKGSVTTYLLTDRLGSVVRETDGTGAVTQRLSYEPYGSLFNGPSQSQPGFTGHVNDPETGFTYMQARYTDVAMGHFLSVDPVAPVPGDVFGFNRYAYAYNNPYKFTDPDGRAGFLYWSAPDQVVFTVLYNMSGQNPQFTAAQFEAQIKADFSGTVQINGKTVTVVAQAVASNKNSPLVNQINVVKDTAGVTKSGRSETNKVGGNQITIGATGTQAASEITTSHEIGHAGGAGDQYKGGVGADGKTLPADVPGPSNVMKDLQGNPANQQTLKEIITAPTNVNQCAKGVTAGNGGC